MWCEQGLNAPESAGGFRAAAGGKRGHREGPGVELMTLTRVLLRETALLKHFLTLQQGGMSGSQNISQTAPEQISRKQAIRELLHKHSTDVGVG